MKNLLIFVGFVLSINCYIECDKIQGRILGGAEATDGQFPYQVHIKLDGEFLCGGVIYNENYILTAAHCLVNNENSKYNSSKLQVYYGTLRSDSEKTGVDVEKTIVHEKYSYSSVFNDIGLIKLQEPLDLSNDSVKSIQLYTGRELTRNQKVRVSGWGRTTSGGSISNALKYADVETITPRECYFRSGIYGRNILCLKHAAGTSICYGDSGGPATYEGKLVGIASWIKSCDSNRPFGYTRVSYYRNWIKNNTS